MTRIIENNAEYISFDAVGECKCPNCKSILYVGNENLINIEEKFINPGIRITEYTFYCPACNRIVKLKQ